MFHGVRKEDSGKFTRTEDSLTLIDGSATEKQYQVLNAAHRDHYIHSVVFRLHIFRIESEKRTLLSISYLKLNY